MFIDDTSFPGDGLFNMARDAELLGRGERALRVYRWDGPWVSLGRFQAAKDALVSDCKVPHVVRPTGGGAVLHGHDVTIALVFPSESRSVKADYERATALILVALNGCGVSAQLAKKGFPSGIGLINDCFAHSSPCDIVNEYGQKICGCALRRTRNTVLLQASIPTGEPLIEPNTVIQRATRHFHTSVLASKLCEQLEKAVTSQSLLSMQFC